MEPQINVTQNLSYLNHANNSVNGDCSYVLSWSCIFFTLADQLCLSICLRPTNKRHRSKVRCPRGQPSTIAALGMVQSWVAASSAAWGWQSSKSGVTIPKSFGFEAATRYGATNQCCPESELFEPCPKYRCSRVVVLRKPSAWTIPINENLQAACFQF